MLIDRGSGIPSVPTHMAAAIPPDRPVPLTGVLLKLLAFSVAMVVLPLGSYYVSLAYVWGEKNYTPAGITAATVANLLLVAFVVMAIREDQLEGSLEEVKKRELAAAAATTTAGDGKVEVESKKDK